MKLRFLFHFHFLVAQLFVFCTVFLFKVAGENYENLGTAQHILQLAANQRFVLYNHQQSFFWTKKMYHFTREGGGGSKL